MGTRISINTNKSATTTFIKLTDVPQSYLGANGDFVKVNSTETGLEFTSVAPGSFDVNTIITASTKLQNNNLLTYVDDEYYLVVTDNNGNVLTT